MLFFLKSKKGDTFTFCLLSGKRRLALEMETVPGKRRLSPGNGDCPWETEAVPEKNGDCPREMETVPGKNGDVWSPESVWSTNKREKGMVLVRMTSEIGWWHSLAPWWPLLWPNRGGSQWTQTPPPPPPQMRALCYIPWGIPSKPAGWQSGRRSCSTGCNLYCKPANTSWNLWNTNGVNYPKV